MAVRSLKKIDQLLYFCTCLIVQLGAFGCGKLELVRRISNLEPTPSPTWKVSDNYVYASGRSATIRGMFIDSSDAIYAVGEAADSSNVKHWVVRQSTDKGATWTVIDDYVYSPGQTSSANSVTVDSSGGIFVLGDAIDSSSGYHWLVRRSTDSGKSWTNVDNFTYSVNAYSGRITHDASGNLYCTGSASDGTSLHWIVRKASTGGTGWTTIDDYQLGNALDSEAAGIVLSLSGTLYVIGSANDISGSSHWVTRSSSNGGVSWATIDNYQFQVNATGSTGNSVRIDSSGNLYSGGFGYDGTYYHWLVRKSTSGGSTWTLVDDYRFPLGSGLSGKDAFLYGFEVGPSNQIYSVGRAKDNSSYHTILRVSSDGGANWKTLDDYQLVSGMDSFATAVGFDSRGALYEIGNGNDGSNLSHWVIRKYAP